MVHRHLKTENILENETRRAVLETVRINPYITFRSLVRVLDSAVGTVDYHINVLAEHGLIRRERFENMTYYAVHDAPKQGLMARFIGRRGRRKIAETLATGPLNHHHISDAAGIPESTTSWHLQRMKIHGLVDLRCQGREIIYSLTPLGLDAYNHMIALDTYEYIPSTEDRSTAKILT